MSTSSALQASIRNGWTSPRLSYRAIEDNETDRTWYHKITAGDPVGVVLTSPGIFRPPSRAMADSVFDTFKRRMLAVVICLAITASTEDASGAQRSDETSNTPAQATSKDPSTTQGVVTPIGILALSAAEPNQHHHRGTRLGIYIVDPYRGKGYGSEAVNWALDWAFRFAGMHRVSLSCYGYNERAQRVYERLGFVKEGMLRDNLWFDRRWHDEVLYGMLEEEWERIRSA